MTRSSEARGSSPAGSVYAGILLCSLAVLMEEILLTRIFSFTIWYHLAYLTISTALLGFGAAGSLIAAFPGPVQRDPNGFAALSATGAGIALLVSIAVLAPNPLDPTRLLTEPWAFALTLLGYYALVGLPFLLAGFAVAAPLAAHPGWVDRLYAADLLGAGLGCAGAVAALTWLDGPGAIVLCAAAFLAAGACYAAPRRIAWALAVYAVGVAAIAPLASRSLEFRTTVSKTLGGAVRHPEFRSLFTQWSPVNRVDLFSASSGRGGFWHAFGVAPGYDARPPRIVSVVYDAHNGSDVVNIEGRESLSVLDHHILSTPYQLMEKPRVLVIGVGGGIDVFNALYHDASRVTGVELQPITVGLHHGMLAAWTGGWMQRPEVELVAAEGRHYVSSHEDRWDIIQLTAVDTFSAQSTGAYVLAESYLYTVEAFGDYLSRLDPGGVLSIVVGDHLYRDAATPTPFSTRLALVAREALRREGIADARPHIVLLGQPLRTPGVPSERFVQGGWTQNLLVSRTPFSPEALETLRGFSARHRFPVRLAPDGTGDPHLTRIVQAPAEELDAILDAQVFAMDPITDDRPFFFHVLPWDQIAIDDRVEWSNPGSAGGQIVLLMMLGQALVLGGALIALPLWRRRRSHQLPARARAGFLLYFLGLGVGFLLIEISFVQKYVLLLGYPTYSLSVTIFSLLVFAAAGAALSRHGWTRPRRFLAGLLGVTVLLVALEVLALPWIRERCLAQPFWVRVAVTALLQLPLGVALGSYFPTGVELLRRRDPALVPWAWAVNGVGSVVAAVLAVMLGMGIGFSGVALVAAGIYTVGTLSLLRSLRPVPTGVAPELPTK